MDDKEVEEILSVALKNHDIKVDSKDPNIRSLVRLLFQRAYSEAYKDIKEENNGYPIHG